LVHNRLAVVPPEEDNDGELADAIRLVLELDVLVHADQIGVTVSERAVTLSGIVARADERRRAELDAWYVPGVREVFNRLALAS
jgi:osmotically-inducible protein OsmY